MNKGDAPLDPGLEKRATDLETTWNPDPRFGKGEPPVNIDLQALRELLRIRDLERKGQGRSPKR
jgi:hypothetical protein